MEGFVFIQTIFFILNKFCKFADVKLILRAGLIFLTLHDSPDDVQAKKGW